MQDGLGVAIRQGRKAKGLTQKELGDEFGLGQSAVAAWERGQNAPDGPTLLKLSRILGVSFGQSGLSADAAYRLGQAADELRAIGEMAERMARQAFAAADRVAVPTPLPPLSAEDGRAILEADTAAKSRARSQRRKQG